MAPAGAPAQPWQVLTATASFVRCHRGSAADVPSDQRRFESSGGGWLAPSRRPRCAFRAACVGHGGPGSRPVCPTPPDCWRPCRRCSRRGRARPRRCRQRNGPRGSRHPRLSRGASVSGNNRARRPHSAGCLWRAACTPRTRLRLLCLPTAPAAGASSGWVLRRGPPTALAARALCREAAPVSARHGCAARDPQVPADHQPAHQEVAVCAAGERAAAGQPVGALQQDTGQPHAPVNGCGGWVVGLCFPRQRATQAAAGGLTPLQRCRPARLPSYCQPHATACARLLRTGARDHQ